MRKSKQLLIVLSLVIMTLSSCIQPERGSSLADNISSWRQNVDATLPKLGHRNWILVVDKAFPMQNAAGITYINSNENLLPVLSYTLDAIDSASHVKPIIYQDKELSFITEAQSKGVEELSASIKKILGAHDVQTIPHDSIFLKIDAAAKLFNVLIIKTNETIPYSSVFLELDCAYWDGEKEKMLRNRMNKK